jgi:hypothetical protein
LSGIFATLNQLKSLYVFYIAFLTPRCDSFMSCLCTSICTGKLVSQNFVGIEELLLSWLDKLASQGRHHLQILVVLRECLLNIWIGSLHHLDDVLKSKVFNFPSMR